MPATPVQSVANYIILLSLFVVDYIVGNGLIEIVQKLFCKILCFTRKVVVEEAKRATHVGNENPISFPVLFIEVVVLTVTIVILNKYKHCRGVDRLDELFDESKDALRQTNEFLEKWRMRRVSKEFSYLDEEPQEIKPLKVEIPILHMAIVDLFGPGICFPYIISFSLLKHTSLCMIVQSTRRFVVWRLPNNSPAYETWYTMKIDSGLPLRGSDDEDSKMTKTNEAKTLGTARSLERGDAGDSANVTDSAILSVTSFDDDFESIPDHTIFEDVKGGDFNNRYLWNVIEEDLNSENM